MARKSSRTMRVTKEAGYAKGLYSLSYDLEGILRTIGHKRTIDLVNALATKIERAKRSARKTAATKILKDEAQTTIDKQLSDNVKRSLQQIRAQAQTKLNRKRAA